jgi:hypothetical protein
MWFYSLSVFLEVVYHILCCARLLTRESQCSNFVSCSNCRKEGMNIHIVSTEIPYTLNIQLLNNVFVYV